MAVKWAGLRRGRLFSSQIRVAKGVSVLVIYCAFLATGSKFGVEVCHVLEYDTEQQVPGKHLLCAWETFEESNESSREAHTRFCV